MAAPYTRVTELDFDTIKANLKTFLKSQTAFTDYDFDGSNLQVLLDLLAYNTHYNAVLANMVSNEMFLDTAIKRGSVASLAKHLRYVPASIKSAKAKVAVTVSSVVSNPTFLNLPEYTLFSTSIDGTSTTFYNRDSYYTTPVDGVYTFPEVEIYQGRKLDFFYTIASNPSPAVKYTIPNAAVDTSTIKVKVTYPNNAVDVYKLVTDITALDGTSLVYFLEQNTDGFYEIFFGDGVLGYNPPAGSIISVEYIVSDGALGNVSTNVPISWSCSNISGYNGELRTVATISKPNGGQNAESTESMRFNAIQRFTTAGRTVTSNDYAAIISAEVPGAAAVNVWGGQNNNPPQYGKVFISVSPRPGYVLTEFEKRRIIKDILRPRSMVTVVHEFVDPVYTYLNLGIEVKYNDSKTNKSASQLAAQVNTTVTTYFDNILSQFNATFYMGQLIEDIMNLDDAIVGVNIIPRQQKRLKIPAGNTYSNTLIWPARIHPNSMYSNLFAYTLDNGSTATVQIRDVSNTMPPDYNGTGTLKLYNYTAGTVIKNIGTINYKTGAMTIKNLKVMGYVGMGSDVRILTEIQENNSDITSNFDEILQIDDSNEDTVSAMENGLKINVIKVTK